MPGKKKMNQSDLPKPKGGKTRVGNVSPSRSPFVAQGNQGKSFDKIMRETYDWWK